MTRIPANLPGRQYDADTGAHGEICPSSPARAYYFGPVRESCGVNITVKQLKALVAVSEAGSFTGAAERLHVTQSALSVIVRELERELGSRLFNRTTRRVELTRSGREFLIAANRMLAELECAVRNARDADSRGRQRLIVGCPPLAAAAVVPDIIVHLRKVSTNVDIVVRDIKPDEIAAATIAGELDLGLGSFAQAPSPLDRIVIADQPLVLISSPDNPIARKRTITWSDLHDVPLISIVGDTTVKTLLDEAAHNLDEIKRPSYEVYHAMTVIGMVAANLGVAILPAWVSCARSLYKFSVKEIEKPTIHSQLSVLFHPERTFSGNMEMFVDALRRHFAARAETACL